MSLLCFDGTIKFVKTSYMFLINRNIPAGPACLYIEARLIQAIGGIRIIQSKKLAWLLPVSLSGCQKGQQIPAFHEIDGGRLPPSVHNCKYKEAGCR